MAILSIGNRAVKLGGGIINVSPPDPEIYVTPTEITGISYLGTTCPVTVCGNPNGSVSVADACTWVVTTTPVAPTVSGTVNNIQVCENLTTSCRSAVVCYTPSLGGAVKCVTVCQSTGDTNIYVTPSTISGVSGDGAYVYAYVCGPTTNTTTVTDACTWIVPATPISPCASPGKAAGIQVCCNTGAARSGLVCFVPTVGATRCVCICQNICNTWKCVDYCIYQCYGFDGSYYVEKWSCLNPSIALSVGECYDASIYADIYVDYNSFGCGIFWLCCNSTTICCSCVDYNQQSDSPYVNLTVRYGDVIRIHTCAQDNVGGQGADVCVGYLYISKIVGCVCAGSVCQYYDTCAC